MSALNTIGMLTENHLWLDPTRYSVGISFFLWGGILILSFLIAIFYTIDRINCRNSRPNRFESCMTQLDWKWIIIAFIVAWSPYLIMHYPTWIGGGVANQVRMFYGEDTRARNMSSIIYEGHYLSSHHPVLLTVYYGMFWKLGDIIGKPNLGVFLLSCCNLLICAGCLTFMVVKMKKHLSARAYTVILIMMCIFPYYGAYSFSSIKDNIYTAALVVFFSVITDSVLSQELLTNRDKLVLFLSAIIIPFLKSQGIVIVTGALLLISIVEKKSRKIYICSAAASFLLFVVIFNHFLMPLLKISPVGRQEALSIPFQQTALVFKEHPESIDEEEYNIVNNILPADDLDELYEPELADSVKFEFNQQATSRELLNYIGVWFRNLFKHPLVYIRAWAGVTDGYYYMAFDMADNCLDHKLEVYDAYWPDWVVTFEEKENELYEKLSSFPVVSQLFKCCLFCWIAIIAGLYLLYSKQYTRFMVILGIELNFFVLLLCPANAYIRYTLPLIWLLPVECALVSGIKNE